MAIKLSTLRLLKLSFLHMFTLLFAAEAHAQQANDIIAAAQDALGAPTIVLHTRVVEGELHMQGGAAPLRVVQGAPDRFLLEATFPIGDLRRGHDGDIAWEMHPLRGARLLGADETELLVRNAAFNPLEVTLTNYPDIELLAPVRDDNREFHAVRFSNASGKSETWYFDAQSHLPARIERDVHAGPGGAIQVITRLEDWRRVDGVAVPFRVETGTATGAIEHRYRTVTHNANIDASIFAPPEQVRALVTH